jgi:hypothetical protein
MEILSLAVGRDDGVVQSYYGVEHEGKLWLVTAWLIETATGLATPERMIRVDSLTPRPMKCAPGDKFHYANILLPTTLIEHPSPDTTGFEVRSLPSSPVVHRDDLKTLPSIFG